MLIKIASIYAVLNISVSSVATIVCIVFAVRFPENITLTAVMYAALWFAFSVILLWGVRDHNFFSVLAYVCFLVISNVMFIAALFSTEFESSNPAPIVATLRISLLVPELLLLLSLKKRFLEQLEYAETSIS
ncbi:uncharacterized protein LOC128093529 [Culex pipiens pallens]|uniref:uncharacterized protein LOC128093529 n=1 Tax=Culex pipiens pallens TaxID=42434 RepID=UPI0022AA8453|nr:uncharacterized protein LOC128093529 [Culex pipiens pallens]